MSEKYLSGSWWVKRKSDGAFFKARFDHKEKKWIMETTAGRIVVVPNNQRTKFIFIKKMDH